MKMSSSFISMCAFICEDEHRTGESDRFLDIIMVNHDTLSAMHVNNSRSTIDRTGFWDLPKCIVDEEIGGAEGGNGKQEQQGSSIIQDY